MRDPARIDRVLAKLRAAWVAHPDSRLGQLIVNLTQHETANLFFVEDDVLEAHVDELNETGRYPECAQPYRRSLAW